jgi:pimeloyl-ACP methyl ester carboxylesterase
VASGDRTEALGRVRVPTLVIHGRDDPLIEHSGGVATASAVPGAELLEIAGMGHDLPREVWPTIIDAVVANTERAKKQAKAAAAQ